MSGTRVFCNGIYTPEQLEELREELKRGDRPGESETERENRAIEILNRRNAERAQESIRADARRRRLAQAPGGRLLDAGVRLVRRGA
jgi:hypothetical protein